MLDFLGWLVLKNRWVDDSTQLECARSVIK